MRQEITKTGIQVCADTHVSEHAMQPVGVLVATGVLKRKTFLSVT